MISYDIEENSMRTRIAKFLERNEGRRIQKSVFMAEWKEQEAHRMWTQLKNWSADFKSRDSLVLMALNPHQMKEAKILGENEALDKLSNPPHTFFF